MAGHSHTFTLWWITHTHKGKTGKRNKREPCCVVCYCQCSLFGGEGIILMPLNAKEMKGKQHNHSGEVESDDRSTIHTFLKQQLSQYTHHLLLFWFTEHRLQKKLVPQQTISSEKKNCKPHRMSRIQAVMLWGLSFSTARQWAPHYKHKIGNSKKKGLWCTLSVPMTSSNVSRKRGRDELGSEKSFCTVTRRSFERHDSNKCFVCVRICLFEWIKRKQQQMSQMCVHSKKKDSNPFNIISFL